MIKFSSALSKKIVFLFVLISSSLSAVPPIEKVIIWGHKLHSHTHSYIHERFFRTFKHMGYETYWFDKEDDVSNFDFSHSLFITEGQVDEEMPVRMDCQYILHNCKRDRYSDLFDASLAVNLQVYTDDVLTRPTCTKIEGCTYFDVQNKCIYLPWASDFLPDEIEEMKCNLSLARSRSIYWIGTIGGGTFGNDSQILPFANACKKSRIEFVQKSGLNRDECTQLISKSYMAPTIVGEWQQEKGYIPCRIFINICCGHMGVTNSYRVYELFEGKIVYNSDSYQLFNDAEIRKKTWTFQDQLDLMDFVKQKHTYINRIQTLLEFLKLTNG